MIDHMRISAIQTTRFYKKVIVGFCVGVVVVFGLILYFSFSKTIITVHLKPYDSTTEYKVIISDSTELNELAELAAGKEIVQGYLLKTNLADSATYENTAHGETIEGVAAGTVTIYNNWSQTQPLTATTRLLTPDGVLFRIKQRVDIPPGSKLENVEVYADQPGASGNIEPTTFTIPGLWEGLQDQIYAESFEPMTGGVVKAKVLTQEIITEGKRSLLDELKTKAAVDLEDIALTKYPDTDFRKTLYPIILSESVSPAAGTISDTFTVDLEVSFIGVFYDQDETVLIGLEQLKKELSDDEEVLRYTADGLKASIESYDYDNQTAQLNIDYTASVVPRLSHPMFDRTNLTGKDEQAIKAYFSNFDEVGYIKIKFSPFWVTESPSLIDHIEIRTSP